MFVYFCILSRPAMIPALAGFQSEHAVEIPFMLTTENDDDDSESSRTGIENAVD